MTNNPTVKTIETLDKALKMIEANPQHWDQTKWHCGTSHCLAGFCDIVEFNEVAEDPFELHEDFLDTGFLNNATKSNFAAKNKGLAYLFRASNQLHYLEEEIEYLKETQEITGYDSDGYDEDGYDEDGYYKHP